MDYTLMFKLVWIILLVFFVIVEFASLSLITIWFALGTLVAFVSSFFIKEFITQSFIFVIASSIFLIFTRPLAMKYLKPKIIKTNVQSLVGKECVVKKSIEKNENGEVKINGLIWSAKAECTIQEGEIVKVLDIDGVKLIVEKVN